MAGNTQKHRDFVNEPMGDKPVKAIPGVGDTLEKNLKAQNFDKAYKVLAKFLMLGKDTELFSNWLKEDMKATPQQASMCARALEEWCNNNL